MAYSDEAIALLAPAIRAAREALRRLDDDEVPARLRRVRSSSARRLPKPLAVGLLTALDEDESLRSRALDRLADDAPTAGVARLWLRRPDGWEQEFADVLGEEAVRSAADVEAGLRAEIERLEGQREADAGKLADLRRAVGDLEGRIAAERHRRGEAVAQAVADVSAEAAGLRRRLADVTEERDAVAGERDRLAERLDEARSELLELRRQRSEPAPVAADPGWATEPLGLARRADEVVAAARARIDRSAEPTPPTGPAPGPDPGPALPPGVAPDTAEAIDALLGWSGVVAVDGYNLAGALGADLGDPPAARDAVRRVADRFRARADGRLLLVFDSADGEGTRNGELFVCDADEELRRLAASQPASTVVVSDDREVIEGVTRVGGVAVWSAAMAAWAARR